MGGFAALLAGSSTLAAELPGPSEPAMPPASAATAPATGAATPVTPAAPAAPAPTAPASETVSSGTGTEAGAGAGSAVQQGETLAAPQVKAPQTSQPGKNVSSGGTSAGSKGAPDIATKSPSAEDEVGGGEEALPPPGEPFQVPSIPSSSCAGSGVPPVLIPIYQRAAAAYGLGPQGPAVLAGINEIETAFGTNLSVSSAGAMGWMQFIPSTWQGYGVDANGDGVRDPYNPEDAIYAAANYLSAAGMPADTYGAIYAYNHADWYVAEVLANAACYSGIGGSAIGGFSLTPQLQVLSCRPGDGWRNTVPEDYMAAFEAAAARYELGRKGVWALAAIARLESNFGRGMAKAQLRKFGPLGLDGSEWRTYAVDGDEDGHIRRADPADSAATLARLIWSRGSLRAGVFTHNQAHWYVEAVMAQAEEIKGGCKVTAADWAVALPDTAAAPINWQNLTLSNTLELHDLVNGLIDPRIVSLIGAITQEHELTISALRSDHSKLTSSGNVSNHYFGRAMDIAAVDGVPCTDTAVDAPCANLARSLAYLPEPVHPTELIYCFDVDGPGEAFALPDHCDHVHAGFYR
jgi:soluble lytic murein transglycosylase-like protein